MRALNLIVALSVLPTLALAGCGDDTSTDATDTARFDSVPFDTALPDTTPPTDTTPPATDAATSAPTDTASPADTTVADTATPDDADATQATDTSATDATTASDGDASSTDVCVRALRPADGPRYFVASHPYLGDAAKGYEYQVGTLSADGETVAYDGATFQLAERAVYEHIAFTPDGEVGVVVTQNGKVGTFTLDEDGAPTVVRNASDAAVYASSVTISDDGTTAWLLSDQWEVHGGGIWAAPIHCDGSLGEARLVAGAKNAGALAWLPGRERAVVAAHSLLGSPETTQAHLLDVSAQATRVAGADAFGDAEMLASSAALTEDGQQVLIGDNNEYADGGPSDRVAIVDVAGDTITRAQLLTGIQDPFDVVTSPYRREALVISGYGNTFIPLSHDASREPRWQQEEAPTWVGPRPQLPSNAVVVRRGGAKGVVLVAQVNGIRHARFLPDGGVIDKGLVQRAQGQTSPGSLGIQP